MGIEFEQLALCAERGWTMSQWLEQPLEHRVMALAERRLQGRMRAIEDQERRFKRPFKKGGA